MRLRVLSLCFAVAFLAGHYSDCLAQRGDNDGICEPNDCTSIWRSADQNVTLTVDEMENGKLCANLTDLNLYPTINSTFELSEQIKTSGDSRFVVDLPGVNVEGVYYHIVGYYIRGEEAANDTSEAERRDDRVVLQYLKVSGGPPTFTPCTMEPGGGDAEGEEHVGDGKHDDVARAEAALEPIPTSGDQNRLVSRACRCGCWVDSACRCWGGSVCDPDDGMLMEVQD